MSRTICLYYEQVCNYIDNDPHLEEWYDYCHKHHCEISEENCINCDTCKEYVSGMSIPTSCVKYNTCYYADRGICDWKWAKNCIEYKEEQE